MTRRVRTLMRKEFIELRRMPQLLRVVIIAPIIQLTMLGYAATTDVRDVPLVVADGDRTSRSRELIARFDASPNFAAGNVRGFAGRSLSTAISEIGSVPTSSAGISSRVGSVQTIDRVLPAT